MQSIFISLSFDNCIDPFPLEIIKKSHRWHGCLSVVSAVCCQVEVSAKN